MSGSEYIWVLIIWAIFYLIPMMIGALILLIVGPPIAMAIASPSLALYGGGAWSIVALWARHWTWRPAAAAFIVAALACGWAYVDQTQRYGEICRSFAATHALPATMPAEIEGLPNAAVAKSFGFGFIYREARLRPNEYILVTTEMPELTNKPWAPDFVGVKIYHVVGGERRLFASRLPPPGPSLFSPLLPYISLKTLLHGRPLAFVRGAKLATHDLEAEKMAFVERVLRLPRQPQKSADCSGGNS